MDKIIVTGGEKLNGEVSVSGAKNSALPLLFSTLLASGEHRFTNVPYLRDIDSTASLLREFGAEVFRENSGDSDVFVVRMPDLKNFTADYDVVRKMRASILCLGPILARYGQAVVSLPGGCAIGNRPVDQHIEGFKTLGAEIEINSGNIEASSEGRLIGVTVLFDGVTVGGTENILMAACLAKGKTIIENAAKEPEIVDLANYLNKMGAKVFGAGTGVITIDGVDKLTPASHTVIPDRIEAGTLLIAGAITGGEVRVKNCISTDIHALIEKMRECGFKIEVEPAKEAEKKEAFGLEFDSVTVFPIEKWKGVDVSTAAHPGFPTDLQAQFMALMTQAEGVSIISETIFENRFMHVQELLRLDADITPKSRVAIIRGEKGSLKGAQVMATDLRASACLVLAGLVSSGETVISRIYHLDRGYEKLEEKLSKLGANIKRVQE